MTSFIFCNLCFDEHSQLKNKFFISPCSHVFCNSCVVNQKNYCPICKTQSKLLEINKEMPSEVKMFFEENSIVRLGKNIQKIQKFQENQARAYINKNLQHRKNFLQIKKDIMKLQKAKQHYLNKMRAENDLMKRLQIAYKTNEITPDLFNEPLVADHQKPLTPTSSKSSPSTPDSSKMQNCNDLTRTNSLNNSPKSTPSPLLKMTLQKMQKASHDKFHALRRQQFKRQN